MVIHPGPVEALLCLVRAVRSAAVARGRRGPAGRARALTAAQQSILNTEAQPRHAGAHRPSPELAAGVATPRARPTRSCRRCSSPCWPMASPTRPARRAPATSPPALGVATSALRTVRLLCEHQMLHCSGSISCAARISRTCLIDQFRHHGELKPASPRACWACAGFIAIPSSRRAPRRARVSCRSDTLGYTSFHHVPRYRVRLSGRAEQSSRKAPSTTIMTHVLAGRAT